MTGRDLNWYDAIMIVKQMITIVPVFGVRPTPAVDVSVIVNMS